MKNKKPVQITQIKISLPNQEIELNAEEARKVYEELYKIFLQESPPLPFKEKEYVPYPIYIDRWIPEPYWKFNTITCDSTAKSEILSINLTNNTLIQ